MPALVQIHAVDLSAKLNLPTAGGHDAMGRQRLALTKLQRRERQGGGRPLAAILADLEKHG